MTTYLEKLRKEFEPLGLVDRKRVGYELIFDDGSSKRFATVKEMREYAYIHKVEKVLRTVKFETYMWYLDRGETYKDDLVNPNYDTEKDVELRLADDIDNALYIFCQKVIKTLEN